MRIVVLGAGAMGGLYGSYLSRGNDVTMVDINAEVVDKINREGFEMREIRFSTIAPERVVTLEDSVTGTDGKRPNWHLPMVQDFVNAVLDGGTPHCTVESAGMTAVITEAIERSAVSGRWQTVPALL